MVLNDEIIELSMEEFLIGNNEFTGLKSVIQKYFEINHEIYF